MPSFTTGVTDLQRLGPLVELEVAVGAATEAALRQAGDAVPSPIPVVAMIDTGASNTVIQQGLAARLGLPPTGMTYVHTASHSNVPCSLFPIRLLFPQNVVQETTALEVPLQGQQIQCLIGRDVLARAVFIYIGDRNLFSLCF